MRNQNRALSVDAFEDRSLPSTTFVFVEPTFSYRSYLPVSKFAAVSDPGGYASRSFQAESFIRIRFADNSVIFIRETPTGFQLIPVFTGTNVPTRPTAPTAPVQGPVADGATSSSGGSAQSTGSGSRPVAQSRGPVLPPGARPGVGDVAIVPTTQSNPVAVRAAADQAAAVAAQESVQNAPPAVAPTSPLLTGYGTGIGYAVTAIVPDGAGAAESVPPVPPTPMPNPAPTPETDGSVESGIVQLATAVVGPVAGLVPFDASALSAGASQFLGRVSDLAPSWPDSMPAFSDTLWVAAAVLLTGGAVYAVRTRSAPTPARDPLTGALSEWERRHGRLAG